MADDNVHAGYTIADRKSYVKIRYTCRAENGPILRGAEGPETMDFVTGFLHVIPGLEKRIMGSCVGTRLEFTVPPEEAFGERRKELVIEKDVNEFHFPAGMKPTPGMEIPILINEEGPETAMIREVNDDRVVIDLNHPLAGVPLKYDLEIIEARPATDKDMCSEWEQQSASDACCGSVPELILQGEESEN